jgi:hypothetical protein
MPRGRQRRKQQQRQRQVAAATEEMAGPPEEHEAAARRQMERQVFTDEGLRVPQAQVEAAAYDLPPEDLDLQVPEHSLLPGIRMFTAMLDEARGGYIVDRLAQLEAALEVEFNLLEREGIIQVASSSLDASGVPDVEFAVGLAIDQRQQLEGVSPTEPDEELDAVVPVVGIDSGMVLICDPAHIASGSLDRYKSFSTENFPSSPMQLHSPTGAPIAVLMHTPFGDGSFPVYIEDAEDGSAAGVVLVFQEPEQLAALADAVPPPQGVDLGPDVETEAAAELDDLEEDEEPEEIEDGEPEDADAPGPDEPGA